MCRVISEENCQALKLLLDQARQENAQFQAAIAAANAACPQLYRDTRETLPDRVKAMAETVSVIPRWMEEVAALRASESRLQTELAEARAALCLFVEQYEGNGNDERENRPEMRAARAVLKRGVK